MGSGPPWNPIGLLFVLAFGATSWPAGATLVLGVELVLVAVRAGAGWWALRRFGVLDTLEGKQFDKRIDRLARTMADPKYLAASTDQLGPAISKTHSGYLGIPSGTPWSGPHPACDLGVRGDRLRWGLHGQVRLICPGSVVDTREDQRLATGVRLLP